jgi:aldehyde dehydrogenase (NAD+)
VEAQLLPVMKKVLTQFYGEKPEQSSDYCRIVSSRHLERLQGLLTSTKGTVALGGRSEPEGKFMEPTVVTGVTWEDPLMQVPLFYYSLKCPL